MEKTIGLWGNFFQIEFILSEDPEKNYSVSVYGMWGSPGEFTE